jgi:uncharacterized membrane protein YtjA (UPF0391 family)
MLYWALMFLVAAMIVGFGNTLIGTAAVTKILFLLCLTLFVMILATHLTRSTS